MSQHWLPEVPANGMGLVATPQPHIQDNCSKEPALKFCHLPPVTLTPQPGHAVMTDRSSHCPVSVIIIISSSIQHYYSSVKEVIVVIINMLVVIISLINYHHQCTVRFLSGCQLRWTKQSRYGFQSLCTCACVSIQKLTRNSRYLL